MHFETFSCTLGKEELDVLKHKILTKSSINLRDLRRRLFPLSTQRDMSDEFKVAAKEFAVPERLYKKLYTLYYKFNLFKMINHFQINEVAKALWTCSERYPTTSICSIEHNFPIYCTRRCGEEVFSLCDKNFGQLLKYCTYYMNSSDTRVSLRDTIAEFVFVDIGAMMFHKCKCDKSVSLL